MADTIREITQLEERLKQADIKNDPSFFEECLADDAVLTGHDGKLFTKQAVVDAHHPPGFQKFSRFDVSDLQIKDYGITAIVTCRIDLAMPGANLALRFTRVWLKQEDRWRVVAGHISTATS